MSAQVKQPRLAVPTKLTSRKWNEAAGRWESVYTAACTRCDFTYSNVVKSDVTWTASCHRHTHKDKP